MNRATLICCYNDEAQYKAFEAQLDEQTEKVDLIAIDNTSNKFSSCAAAFNSIINVVTTDMVIYSHQDIHFERADNIQTFLDYLSKLTENDILGVAGVKLESNYTYSNIYDGQDKKKVGKYTIDGLEECFTFDECFFGGFASYFRKNPFDEEVCNNWHLYAVEQCLRAKRLGGHSYICSTELYHMSHGVRSESLNDGFLTLSKAYHKDFDYICTTCCKGYTGPVRRAWGYSVRNAKYGHLPSGKLARFSFKKLKRAAKKNQFLHKLLYGEKQFL